MRSPARACSPACSDAADPPLHCPSRAPVAQGIERCPAEAEVACSNLAGRTRRAGRPSRPARSLHGGNHVSPVGLSSSLVARGARAAPVRPRRQSALSTDAVSGCQTRSAARRRAQRASPTRSRRTRRRSRSSRRRCRDVVLARVDERERHRRRVEPEQVPPAAAQPAHEEERDQQRVRRVQRRHRGDVVRVPGARLPERVEADEGHVAADRCDEPLHRADVPSWAASHGGSAG